MVLVMNFAATKRSTEDFDVYGPLTGRHSIFGRVQTFLTSVDPLT